MAEAETPGCGGRVKDALIRNLVRIRFTLTSRAAASRMIDNEAEKTLSCLDQVVAEDAARSVKVPSMLGVDEDMREWSLFQILEHNTIVNHALSRVVECLAKGVPVESDFNPKTDVMPSATAGEEQIAAFKESIQIHRGRMQQLGNLRNTKTHPHPIFGPLAAHGMHCMMGFHLMVHRRQAEVVTALLHKG